MANSIKKQVNSSGSFIKLPDGLVHYQLSGPKNKRTVVLIHGFSVPYYNWDNTFDFLVESGCRVLRYDVYGRGFSDKPIVQYTKDFYYNQLSNLLSALKINSQIDLIGFSMGGIIAAVFANRNPQLIRSICLISPAGMPMVVPIALNIIKLPGAGEIIMKFFGNDILASEVRKDLYEPEKYPKYFENYSSQLQYPGFKHSLLSTLRSGMLFDSENEYTELGKKNLKTILIWGKEDNVVFYSLHKKFIMNIPKIKLYPINKAGHASHYECPKIVNPILLNFLTM